VYYKGGENAHFLKNRYPVAPKLAFENQGIV
jgi:hypothetical protein